MNSFLFSPDRSIKKPLYEQLYHAFVENILSGKILPGERLPSKRALSTQMHLSLTTVETAYSLLMAEGYIVSRPRSGYFVSAVEIPLNPKLHSKLQDSTYKPFVISENSIDETTIRKNRQISLMQFSVGTTDTSTFPYATWAKIMKTAIYDISKLPVRSDPQGDITLRTAIAKLLYEIRGVHCSPDQIIIGAGIEYILDLVIQLFGNDAIYAFENPGHLRSLAIMRNHQSKVQMLNIDNHGLCVEKLEQSNANLAYIMPSHQFPTGITMPIGRRLQLLNWAEQHSAYIIENDYDSEFRYKKYPLPALQSFDRLGRVLFLSTFSKSIAPSIRTAYLVLPENLLPAYHAKFRYYLSPVSQIEQLALAGFINGGHFIRHLRRMTLLYEKKRNLLIDALRNEAFGTHIKIHGEHAGLHFIVTLNIGISEKELKQRALMKGVVVHGLSEYCTPDLKLPEPTLVLGYGGLSEKEILKGVKLLGEAWK